MIRVTFLHIFKMISKELLVKVVAVSLLILMTTKLVVVKVTGLLRGLMVLLHKLLCVTLLVLLTMLVF